MKMINYRFLAAAAALILWAASAQAISVSWNNAAGGAWSDSTNWSPQHVPSTGDDAHITMTGTYSVTLGTTVSLNSLEVGTVGGPGTQSLQLSSLTMTLATPSVVRQSGLLQITNSILTGAGDLTVNGTVNWISGTISGTGALVISSGASMTLSGINIKIFDTRTISNSGTVTWTGTGDIYTYNGVVFNNQLSGLFLAQNDQNFYYNGGVLSAFNNYGTVRKNTATGLTTFNGIPFNSLGGTVDLQSGNINLTASETSTGGTFTVASGSALDLTGGTHIFSGSYSGAGAGLFRLSNATLQVAAGGCTFNFSTGGFAWAAGTITGGVLTNSGIMSIAGTANKILNGGTISNSGTATWTGTGEIFTYNAAAFNNQSGGLFDAQVDLNFYYSGGTMTTFNNQGTLRKSAGTVATIFNGIYVVNGGLVQVQTGAIRLLGGGTTSGTINTAASTEFQFSGGTDSLNAGTTFAGSGLTRLNGGTLTVAAPVSIALFEMDAGILNGPSVFTFTGSMTWTGGTMGGSGQTAVAASGNMTISGTGSKILDTRTFNNSGTVTWTGTGEIFTYNAAIFNNLAGGLFDAQNNQNFYYSGGALSAFNNTGTVRKSAGSGTTQFNSIPFNNNGGTVNVQTGTIADNSTDTGTGGTLTVASGAVLQYNGGTHNLSGVYSGAGAGPFQLTSGVIHLVTGGATFSLAGGLEWINSTVNGTSLTNTGLLRFTGVGSKILDGATLINTGTITWPGSGEIFMQNGALLNNQSAGLFDILSDLNLYNNGGVTPQINNAGLFRKSSGSGATNINVAMNNTGTVRTLSGTLNFAGGGSSSGNFDVSAATSIQFTGGTSILLSGATATGTGNVNLTGGTLQISGSAAMQNFRMSGGILTGDSTLSVAASGDWSSGTMNGNGVFKVLSGCAFTISGAANKILDHRTFTNLGTVGWTGAGGFFGQNGAVFNNLSGGLFDAQGDEILYFNGGVMPAMNNSGTLRKSAGGEINRYDIPVNNTGIVSSLSGMLDINGGGTSSGNFNATSSNAVEFTGGTHVFQSGVTGTGPGNVNLTAGTLQVSGSSTLLNFAMTGGILTGDSVLNVSGSASWSSGTMSGNGATTYLAGSVLAISGNNNKILDHRTINNFGTINWTGAGGFYVSNAATINNQGGGIFDAQGDENLYFNGGATSNFNNSGTVRKSIGVGIAAISGPVFNNNGIAQSLSGTLALANGGTSTGIFSPSTGATLSFTTGTFLFNAGTAISGTGPCSVAGATVTVNAPVSATVLDLASGILNGAASLTINTSFSWEGGTMSGASTTLVSPGCSFTLGGAANKILDTRTFNLGGNGVWTNGYFYEMNGAAFTILAGGVFDAQCDLSFNFNGGAMPSITNNGEMRKTAGTGTTTFATMPFMNNGILNPESGTIAFSGNTITNATTGLFEGRGTLNFNGATLVNNGATGPGSSPGILTVITNFTLTPGSSVNIEVGGDTVGTQYDQLVVPGTLNLDGVLNVSTLNGYIPPNGHEYHVISWGTQNGLFAGATGLAVNDSIFYEMNYRTDGLYLVAHNLRARSLVLGQVGANWLLSWVASNGAVSYNVYQVNLDGTLTFVGNTVQTSLDVTTLVNAVDARRFFVVKAVQ